MRRWLVVAIALPLVAAAALALAPVRTGDLKEHPRPAAGYGEALARIDSLRAGEGAEVDARCRVLLLTHGARAARAVVFLHGLSNCPQQFRRLGELCFARGDNVLIVRLPGHGLADRMTGSLARITAADLAAFADAMVDVGAGLGDRLVVVGLSAGGVAAGWAAQTRTEVDRAVLIAPVFGLDVVPRPLTAALTNLWLATPNQFIWWDPVRREKLPGPTYCYPRFATRGLAEVMRLGFAVEARARRSPPAARSIVLVTNPRDRAVSRPVIAALARRWRRLAPRAIETYEFPAAFDLGHDLVDPEQPFQHVDRAYPVLLEIIAGGGD
ncbi:MAG TPA: alpha/beta fold hydrolase [Candidatus Eisenbacteria bacterium]|jgi:carboxylesterase